MNKNYKIRKIKAEDVLALHNVYFLTWLDIYPNKEFNITAKDIVYKYEQRLTPKKIAESREKILQTKDNELKLLLEYQGEVVALCNVVKNQEYNQLQAIYVLPEYQRLGLGSSLWLEAKKFLDLNKKTIVHVAAYNNNAIRFYERLGFISTGKVYSDPRFKMRNGAIIPELEMIRLADKN
jgi:ribosomal protein S18 acetylase RimI-like enzyme